MAGFEGDENILKMIMSILKTIGFVHFKCMSGVCELLFNKAVKR